MWKITTNFINNETTCETQACFHETSRHVIWVIGAEKFLADRTSNSRCNTSAEQIVILRKMKHFFESPVVTSEFYSLHFIVSNFICIWNTYVGRLSFEVGSWKSEVGHLKSKEVRSVNSEIFKTWSLKSAPGFRTPVNKS